MLIVGHRSYKVWKRLVHFLACVSVRVQVGSGYKGTVAVQGSKYPSPYLWMFGENSTLPVNRTVHYTSGLVLSGEHNIISTFLTVSKVCRLL